MRVYSFDALSNEHLVRVIKAIWNARFYETGGIHSLLYSNAIEHRHIHYIVYCTIHTKQATVHQKAKQMN